MNPGKHDARKPFFTGYRPQFYFRTKAEHECDNSISIAVPGHGPDLSKLTSEEISNRNRLLDAAFEAAFSEGDENDDGTDY